MCMYRLLDKQGWLTARRWYCVGHAVAELHMHKLTDVIDFTSWD